MDEKIYEEWLAGRSDIAPEPRLAERIMAEIRQVEAAGAEKPEAAITAMSYSLLDNRWLRYALMAVVLASGLFRLVYVPSLIFIP